MHDFVSVTLPIFVDWQPTLNLITGTLHFNTVGTSITKEAAQAKDGILNHIFGIADNVVEQEEFLNYLSCYMYLNSGTIIESPRNKLSGEYLI